MIHSSFERRKQFSLLVQKKKSTTKPYTARSPHADDDPLRSANSSMLSVSLSFPLLTSVPSLLRFLNTPASPPVDGIVLLAAALDGILCFEEKSKATSSPSILHAFQLVVQ